MNSQTTVPGPVEEPTESIGQPSDNEKISYQSSAEASRAPGEVGEKTEKMERDVIANEVMEDNFSRNNSFISLIVIAFGFCWLLYISISALITASNAGLLVVLPLTIVTLLFIGVFVWLSYREWRAFQTFDLVLHIRESIQTADPNRSCFQIKEQFKPVLKNLRQVYPDQMGSFDSEAGNRDTISEYVSLMDNVVFSKADAVVDSEIKKASISVAALVSISPHPVLDALFVMVRATMLIKKIGECYGMQPTRWTSLKLFKHLLLSAISSAVVEEISSKVIEDIGAGITEKTLKVASEVLVSSSRMYRLGYLTKKLIRPVPSN